MSLGALLHVAITLTWQNDLSVFDLETAGAQNAPRDFTSKKSSTMVIKKAHQKQHTVNLLVKETYKECSKHCDKQVYYVAFTRRVLS